MTIDERLEALRQSLEQWSQMRMVARKEYEEHLRSLDEVCCANEAPCRADDELFPANEERLAHLMDTKNRLGRILEKHGQRLDDLERH